MVEGETAEGRSRIGPVHRIIAATGQRPDLSLTRELRLDLDPWLESTKALGPLIDPNQHSCGEVPPHGHRELAIPNGASIRSASKAMAGRRRSCSLPAMSRYARSPRQSREISRRPTTPASCSRRRECARHSGRRRQTKPPAAAADPHRPRSMPAASLMRSQRTKANPDADAGWPREHARRMSPRHKGPRAAVSSSRLGVTQILAWVSSIICWRFCEADCPGSRLAVRLGRRRRFLGLLTAGLASPRVGDSIQHRGGRPVLAVSAFLLSLGLIGLALAPLFAAVSRSPGWCSAPDGRGPLRRRLR